MNNDLISRSALKEEFLKYKPYAVDFLSLIDNAPTVTPDKIQAIMSDYLVYRCETQRPQDEITNEDIQQAIKEGFANGYEMAKSKYKRPQGEWIIDQEGDKHSCTLVTCPFCGERHCCKMNFCGNCGADMRKGGAE